MHTFSHSFIPVKLPSSRSEEITVHHQEVISVYAAYSFSPRIYRVSSRILLVSLTFVYHYATFRECQFRAQFSSSHAFCIAVHPAVLDLITLHMWWAVKSRVSFRLMKHEKASYRPRQIRLVTWASCGTRIAVIVRSCLDPVPGLLWVLPMQVNANFNNYCLLLQAVQRIQDMLHRLALTSKVDANADRIEIWDLKLAGNQRNCT
jgi:hypothetical protein